MTTKSVPAPPPTRELRGLALYRDHAGEITRVYPHVYRVPSCSGEAFYTVHLAPRERCDCPDTAPVCKHIIACTLKRAKSRTRVAS